MMLAARGAIRASGAGLPYDAEVEYLESSGTQYIDTNTIDDPVNNIAQITFSIPTSTGATMNLFGSSGSRFNYVSARWGSNRYNLGPSASTTPVLPISVGDIHVGTYTLINNELTYTLDGESAVYSSSLVYDDLPLAIFCIYGRPDAAPFIGRVYSFKVIRKSDGTVIADYIPVRKKTVGYLYDRVSGKLFGNAGSGVFSYGSDVVPVEWLSRATNTPYINTLWTPTKPFDVVASIKIQNADGDKAIMGARDDSLNDGQGIGLLAYASGVRTATGRYGSAASNPSVYTTAPFTAGEFFTVKFGVANSKIFYETTSRVELPISADRKTSDWDKAPNPFLLFKFSPTTTRYPITDLYCESVDIYEESILVRAMKPVRVGTGSTWEGAMIDTLTRRIYRNAGTGAFTFGNDLKYPIPA